VANAQREATRVHAPWRNVGIERSGARIVPHAPVRR
jgi:hypothetical protein